MACERPPRGCRTPGFQTTLSIVEWMEWVNKEGKLHEMTQALELRRRAETLKTSAVALERRQRVRWRGENIELRP